MTNPGYESKYDWLIHRKLIEESVVYYIPARANGKIIRSLKRLLDLVSSGREIRLIYPQHN